jgi:hypothetical protein
MAYRTLNREDFSGDERWITATWDAETQQWQFRPAYLSVVMTATEIQALGLDDPLTSPLPRPEPQAFSQRDPRWADVHLGASAYTMGSAGCAVTAAAMVASVVQPAVTPLTLVDWLNVNYGFTGGGLLYWGKVAEAVPGLKFVAYHLWRAVPADMALLALALQNGPQVIQVDFHPETATLDSHFVTAVRLLDDGADLEIIDPWTGASGPLLALYSAQNWTLARAVYALVEFKL